MAERDSSQDSQQERSRLLEQRVGQLEGELAALRGKQQYWRHLEEILDTAPLAIYLKDASFRYVLVNREYERLSGGKREQILGREDFEVLPEPIAKLFREQDLEVIARQGPVDFRETVPLAPGIRSFITSKFLLREADGSISGIAGVCTDITDLEKARVDLEQAQSDLVKQERLALLGELSAMIAHEVRNPLGVMFNALSSLKRMCPPGLKDSHELLDIIGEEADRLNRMVGALLEIVRPIEPELAPTAIGPLAAQAVAAARALAPESNEVKLDVDRTLPLARVDARMVHQAITNLVSNAIQAPKRHGPVVVRIALEGSAREMLRIEVIDDGVGVPEDLRERIFEPFFTTRPAGTGLGLAVVRRLAEAHRGSICVETTKGGGATFVLRLPI